MFSVETDAMVGNFKVETTSYRGFTPEELAVHAVDKIVYVGSQSHPAIRDQAEAFKKQVEAVILHYLKQAVASHNTTIANRLTQAGHPELIKILD